MNFSNEAEVSVGTYEGPAEVEYTEADNRFTIRKINDGVAAGFLFGIIGRLLVRELTSGKELVSFCPDEITQVKVSPTKRQNVYYFYSSNSARPYEITVETDTYLTVTIQKLFADKLVEITAR